MASGGVLKELWRFRCAYMNGLDVLPDGNLVVAPGAGCVSYGGPLKVYHQVTGRKLGDLCQEDICAVSVDKSSGTVAALGWDYLHIMKPERGGYQHQKIEMCKRSVSVACTQDEHFIVCDYEKNICKYNDHGEQIWQKQLSYLPRYMAMDHQNQILISDTEGGRVRVYDTDGQEMFSFPTDKAQRKLKPRGICVDSTDNIIVCDVISSAVLVYDRSGQFIREMLKMDWKPEHVAIYNDKHLAVIVKDEYRGGLGTNKDFCMYKV